MARKSSSGCLGFIITSIAILILFYALLIIGLGILWIIIAIIHIIFLFYTIPLISGKMGANAAMLWLILNIIGGSILMGIFAPFILKVTPEIQYDPAFIKPFLIGGGISLFLLFLILIFEKD